MPLLEVDNAGNVRIKGGEYEGPCLIDHTLKAVFTGFLNLATMHRYRIVWMLCNSHI